MLVKRYLFGIRNFLLSIFGMFKLNCGDCVEVKVKFNSDGNFIVLLGSSFLGFFFGVKREFV